MCGASLDAACLSRSCNTAGFAVRVRQDTCLTGLTGLCSFATATAAAAAATLQGTAAILNVGNEDVTTGFATLLPGVGDEEEEEEDGALRSTCTHQHSWQW
jgi:hypothetical protein